MSDLTTLSGMEGEPLSETQVRGIWRRSIWTSRTWLGTGSWQP